MLCTHNLQARGPLCARLRDGFVPLPSQSEPAGVRCRAQWGESWRLSVFWRLARSSRRLRIRRFRTGKSHERILSPRSTAAAATHSTVRLTGHRWATPPSLILSSLGYTRSCVLVVVALCVKGILGGNKLSTQGCEDPLSGVWSHLYLEAGSRVAAGAVLTSPLHYSSVTWDGARRRSSPSPTFRFSLSVIFKNGFSNAICTQRILCSF